MFEIICKTETDLWPFLFRFWQAVHLILGIFIIIVKKWISICPRKMIKQFYSCITVILLKMEA